MNADIRQAAAYLRRAAEELHRKANTERQRIEDTKRELAKDIHHKETSMLDAKQRASYASNSNERAGHESIVKALQKEIDDAKATADREQDVIGRNVEQVEVQQQDLLRRATDLENKATQL